MAEELLYLPKILFQARPYGRACLRGNSAHPKIHGESLFYPFHGGSLLVTALRGLPEDGFYEFHIYTGTVSSQKSPPGGHVKNPDYSLKPVFLPPLLSSSGFSYMITYTGGFTPEEVIGETAAVHTPRDNHKTQPAQNTEEILVSGVITRNQFYAQCDDS